MRLFQRLREQGVLRDASLSGLQEVVMAGNQAAHWDEFWHWLPNAAYAFSHGSLVKLGLAPSFSHFSGYPQAMQLMIAAASLVAERFLEAAGPVVNVALLAGVSALLADAIAAALARRKRLAAAGTPLFLVASAVAVTILLNPGETKNDPELAKKFARFGDIFVNDAFGSAHRAHASVVGITRFVAQAAAGLLMEKELAYLGKAVSNPARPFVAIH